ncbi:hypothetical protein KP509_09G003300 [Ceratopteris richardii]|uniref:Uncharacterized protein n=1 Tax=Ceratopteris richardii TaxID=49495 RepID=A0A8T2U402_CERRI|nr:hypothetical protein KP509_09G003300 [Ceratopteris richardii]
MVRTPRKEYLLLGNLSADLLDVPKKLVNYHP